MKGKKFGVRVTLFRGQGMVYKGKYCRRERVALDRKETISFLFSLLNVGCRKYDDICLGI